MAGVEQKGSFLGAISPWSTPRSATPQLPASDLVEGKDALQRSQGEDHTVTHRHKLSLRQYPKDCPPLRVRWFYAVDSPKRKPAFSDLRKSDSKSLPLPKKFVPFSFKDSQSIEAGFQKLSDLEDAKEQSQAKESTGQIHDEPIKVPVNEDYLFDVDVEQRELSPAYWVGPVYEVRRGTWFFQDGSTLKPCEENLATQLEEGFLKLKPWQLQNTSKPGPRPSSVTRPNEADKVTNNTNLQSSVHQEPGPSESRSRTAENLTGDLSSSSTNEPVNYRLFGAYMNSTVTYQDSSTAWLRHDDFMSRMSTTVYQKFGGVAGTKVIRGFSEAKKSKEPTDAKGIDRRPVDSGKAQQEFNSDAFGSVVSSLKEKAGSDSSQSFTSGGRDLEAENVTEKNPRSTLERQMSSLAGEPQSTAELEEEARQQEEKEMEDLREVDEDREREIDHLVLVTHGIGQRLGLRLESINFIHDVNVLRKTLKSVYKASPDLQTLNSAFADSSRNCRVQVLPVCWRHLLDFPYRGFRQNRKELDLADADNSEDDVYPALADITLEGVPAVRNLISDLAMDVLLYQSAYCGHIASIVQQECNRVLKLFKERNPSFKGSVSLCGHSLGSAIFFDILCHQQNAPIAVEQGGKIAHDNKTHSLPREIDSFPLDFECEEFFCLGSPIALFQMLKGKRVAGRSKMGVSAVKDPLEFAAEAGVRPASASARYSANARSGGDLNMPATVSSPKCQQLYNIFHPSDPVSYRIEPLISPAMSALKPQPLPSVKKSLWAVPGQSLSILGTRVGQSVGTLWTHFTSGVASSLLNRSLGLTSDDVSPQASSSTGSQSQRGSSIPTSNLPSDKHHLTHPSVEGSQQSNARFQNLIEPELETLYDGFQKSRIDQKKSGLHSSASEDTVDYLEMEDHAKKLRAEDAKIRALNSNGRVDYSIQEGAFDISLIASIASHLSYWADEDVNHFMLSQMLSRRSKQRSKPSIQ